MMPLSNSRVQLGLALWFPFGACELRLIPLWFPFGPLGFPLVPLGVRSPWIPFAPLGYPATGRAPPFVESFMECRGLGRQQAHQNIESGEGKLWGWTSA
jgi:hypothetical protein